ncbi:MAG: YceD family protein [Pseudomonadales bacterium]
MNTRPEERLPYLELARQGARVVRSVQADAFARLADIAPAKGVMQVEMNFSLDENGRARAVGSAEVVVNATCQRCLEQLERPMRVTFDLCIVEDAELASELARSEDVLAADSESVTVAQVVEDELILALPERLCVEEPCPLAPALSYPAAEADEAEPDENPFSVLSLLKR